MVDKRKKRAQKDKKRREAIRKAKAAPKRLPESSVQQALHDSHQAIQAGNPGRAEAILTKVLKSNPEHPQVHANLVAALERLDRIDDAVRVAKRCTELHPRDGSGFNNLGATLKFRGDFEAARAAFVQAVELDPTNSGAWRNLASVKRFTERGDPHLTGMQARLDSLPERAPQRIELEFALGKAFEDLGDADASFPHYDRGNKAKRLGIPFRLDKLTSTVEHLIATVGPEFLDQGPAPEASDEAPILVVGMPRSGSTLVEQILASHPDVVGVGEVRDLVDTLQPLMPKAERFADTLVAMSPEELALHGKTYASKLRARVKGPERIVDKFLFNYLHVGFLARALPNAKIVNTLRDPMDTCFACYKVHFTSPVMFAYDLEELGAVYQLHRRVMDHWNEVLPGRVLDLQYEELVADQEGQSRRLLEFCDLPWNDDVLAFHTTKRRVNSASATQVRKPIYKSSIQKWRPYEAHLGRLRDALGPYAPH